MCNGYAHHKKSNIKILVSFKLVLQLHLVLLPVSLLAIARRQQPAHFLTLKGLPTKTEVVQAWRKVVAIKKEMVGATEERGRGGTSKHTSIAPR